MDSAEVGMWLAITVAAAAIFIDVLQTRSIRKIDRRAEDYEPMDVGEALGDWLLKPQKTEDGKEMTNLQVCAVQVGQVLYNSLSMGMKGMMSGEARQLQGIERKILENTQDPQMQSMIKSLDEIGIPKEVTGLALRYLQANPQLMGKIGQNNGHQTGGGSNY